MFLLKVSSKKHLLQGKHCVYESVEDLQQNISNTDKFFLLPGNKKVYTTVIEHEGKLEQCFVFSKHCSYTENWRNADLGDWVKTTDGGIILCLGRTLLRNKTNEKYNQFFVRLVNGFFNATEKYNYPCTYKKKKSSGNASKRLDGDKKFYFKPKHEKFVISFALSLKPNVPLDTLLEEAWFSVFNKTSKFGIDHNYTIKLKYFMWHVLKHDKSIKLLNRFAMNNKTYKEIMETAGLTKEKLVNKIVEGLNLPAKSPTSVAYVRLGMELHASAEEEERKAKEGSIKQIEQANLAEFQIQDGGKKQLPENPQFAIVSKPSGLNTQMLKLKPSNKIKLEDEKNNV